MHEARTKLSLQLQEKSDQSEVTATLSHFTSDNTQRLLDLRNEIFTRLTESLTQMTDSIARKASVDDVRRLAEEKLDLSVFKSAV